MTGKEIQHLRHKLAQDVYAFGARFGVSGRTVQQWECERNRPHPAVRLQLDALDRKTQAHRK